MSEMQVLLSVSAQDLSRLSLNHELERFDVVIVTHSWFKRISCLGNRAMREDINICSEVC